MPSKTRIKTSTLIVVLAITGIVGFIAGGAYWDYLISLSSQTGESIIGGNKMDVIKKEEGTTKSQSATSSFKTQDIHTMRATSSQTTMPVPEGFRGPTSPPSIIGPTSNPPSN